MSGLQIAFEISDLFRALIHQKDEYRGIVMVGYDRVGHVLQYGRFS